MSIAQKEKIQFLKRDSVEDSLKVAIDIEDATGSRIGLLQPVGEWILNKPDQVDLIKTWRQRAMKMFFVQFESTHERTLTYLKDLSIGQDNRLFFMIRDVEERVIGHIGISNANRKSVELDNIMRGVQGGDPRLIYQAEVSLLAWCFNTLGIEYVEARVASYNWMAASLHQEIGFTIFENQPLRKYEENGVIYHEPVSAERANVRYFCTKLILSKDDFQKRHRASSFI